MYTGLEKRRFPRVSRPFLLYYTPFGMSEAFDLTQVKNISLGGVLFTTSSHFEKGTNLSLKIRLPGLAEPVSSIATVIDSRHPSAGARFFDTRVEFSSIAESDRTNISQAIQPYLK